MNSEKQIFDLLVDADQATTQKRPGYDDYVVVQALLAGVRARIPERMRVRMDVTKALNDAGLYAAKCGYYEESASWFSLAWKAAKTDDEVTNAAFESCVAAAEAFVYWREGKQNVAEEKILLALDRFMTLETRHGWAFLLPLRIHYAHLLSRIAFAEKKFDYGFSCVVPGTSGVSTIPNVSDIVRHAEAYPDERAIVLAPLRRMAGEIAIVSRTCPEEVSRRLPLIRQQTENPLIHEAFAETLDLLTALHENHKDADLLSSNSGLQKVLARGRGKTITWYVAVSHVAFRLRDPAIRVAIAARAARWPDIPVPIRQAILDSAAT